MKSVQCMVEKYHYREVLVVGSGRILNEEERRTSETGRSKWMPNDESFSTTFKCVYRFDCIYMYVFNLCMGGLDAWVNCRNSTLAFCSLSVCVSLNFVFYICICRKHNRDSLLQRETEK